MSSTRTRPPVDVCRPSEVVEPEKVTAGPTSRHAFVSFSPADHRISKAYSALEQAVEDGASPTRIASLQKALDTARAEVAEAERKEDELLAIKRGVERKKVADESAARLKAGATAAAKQREADGVVLVAHYGALTVRAYPARAQDQTVRMQTVEAFRAAVALLTQAAEHDVQQARVRGEGKEPRPGWTLEGLARRIADDARFPLRENCFSISTGNRD